MGVSLVNLIIMFERIRFMPFSGALTAVYTQIYVMYCVFAEYSQLYVFRTSIYTMLVVSSNIIASGDDDGRLSVCASLYLSSR